jgi:hypothetical protein
MATESFSRFANVIIARRTHFLWLRRRRRAKDWECLNLKALAFQASPIMLYNPSVTQITVAIDSILYDTRVG